MTQALALGIDIGGTNTAFGVVNKNGEILEKSSLSTRDYDTLDDYINGLKEAITPVINRMGRENFKGAGIGAPNGNFFTGEIVFAPNLPWKGILPIKKLTQEALGMNTVITNDANAATIGEMQYGAAKGMKDFILVTLGTGVGSGFVSGGSLIYGSDGFAGELGHVIAVRNGRRCGCGRLGCLETYASATGIVRTAHEWLEENNQIQTVLLQDPDSITARKIHLAAANGDDFALRLFEFTGQILGQTLADAVAITSPQAIIFFGGLARAGELLFNPVRRYMEDSLLNIYKNKVSILSSALPDADAAILGSSALVW
jgi:glucokinase